MSDTIFAPLSVRELYVVASDFSVAGSPADGMLNQLDFSYEEAVEEVDGDDLRRSVVQKLGVTTRLLSEDDHEDERMRASVTIRIRTECGVSEDNEEHMEGMIRYMRVSGVSIAYGHARSCIAGMAALSPVGSILIPAIDPQALLERLESE